MPSSGTETENRFFFIKKKDRKKNLMTEEVKWMIKEKGKLNFEENASAL